jgi:hypothetical protein
MIENSMMNTEHMTLFKKAWVEFDPLGTGFITTLQLRPLLSLMPPPLGYSNACPEDTEALLRFVDHVDFPIYMENKYHFFDVCSELANYIYRSKYADIRENEIMEQVGVF